MRRLSLVAAWGLIVLSVLVPSTFVIATLRGPALASDPHLRGGALLLRALLGFHGVVILALDRLRALPAEPLCPRGISPPTRPTLGEAWPLALFLALATALRFHALDQGLWFDEIDTLVSYVRRPLGEILTTFDSQNQHLLYSIAARLSVATFGESAWALRLPAVVFGVASLYAVWRLARRLTGPREALFALAFLCVSYHHVWFSQNARGYTGLLLFTTLGSEAFLGLLSARTGGRFGLAWAYAVAMALAVWTHATATLVVAAHGATWLVLLVSERGRPTGANRWVPAIGFALATSLSLTAYALVLDPFLATLSAPTMAGQEVEWKNPAWLVRETLAGLAKAAPGGPLAALAFGVLAGGVAFLGLVSYARQGRAVLATLLGGLVTTALALVLTRHNLWPRFFFFAAGGLVLVLGRGLCEWVRIFARGAPLSRWSPNLQRALLALLVLASAATVPRAYGPKQDFERAARFLDGEVPAGEAVVTLGMTTLPLRELYARGWSSADTLQELRTIEAAHPRTWLVYCTPTHLASAFPDVWKHIEERYELVATFPGTVGGSDVAVVVQRQ